MRNRSILPKQFSMPNNQLIPILSGAIGALCSIILYPIFVFFVSRCFNKCRLKVVIDNADTYKSLRIKNSSFSTLKNVIVYVTIDNTKNDIVINNNLKTFCHDQVVEDRLSWAKNIDGKNKSEIDINQGESQKLNLLCIRSEYIEVASEHGFPGGDNYGRVLLNHNRNYKIEIKITGENFFSKKMKLKYNTKNQKLEF